MKILSWNCRGLGNPRKVHTLQTWCWRERPDVVFIMESMIDKKRLEGLRGRCGFNNGFCISSEGNSGGIGLWWRDVNVSVVSFSKNHIAANILGEDNNPIWMAVGMYGWPETENKWRTWDLMRQIRGNSNVPVLFFGDFNEITSAAEKAGGVVRRDALMDAFRGAIDDCGLRDLGFRGNPFTWQRGSNPENMIRERLDRFLACEGWSTMFQRAMVHHLPIFRSDHAPIILNTEAKSDFRGSKRQSYFEALWLSDEKCENVVKEAWESGVGEEFSGRIEGCSQRLRVWAAERFGATKKRIKEAEKELTSWQGKFADALMIRKCNELSTELEELHRREETYWHARARANELRDGDKNTSYFHHKASSRRKRNQIDRLKDEAGVWKDNKNDIERVISDYFLNLFASSNPTMLDEAVAGVRPSVTDEMNNALNASPSVEEIHDALFQMHPNKAPGPDGMHALFYQKFWHIVGPDVVSFVQGWWNGTADLTSINRTCIVLIPKCKIPEQMSEFRPISLCNVSYKIVSKVLANRLKVILPGLISQNQSAFVPGRLITDNAIVAVEIFHAMKRNGKGKTGNMALKLDMSKAYDRVEWSFLEKVMRQMGFNNDWIRRILMCVSSVSFSFKLNGSICGNIDPSRGLRQGDPISPYLFLLCVEGFSSLLSTAAERSEIHGAKVCRNAPRVSHLFFADDSILFARATIQECSKIADIIRLYERASGQKINFSKSEVSFSKGVEAVRRNEIIRLLELREVDRHEKYLGLPTVIGRSKKMVFGILKERIWNKLQGWKEKLLSRAGKETLIKAVAQAIPTYMMSIFQLPESLLNDINGMMARFWWGSTGVQRKMHWVSWEKLCLPKAMGGMGFRDLKAFNQALLAKQGWRLMENSDSLAHKILKARYFKNCDFIDSNRGYDPSFVWRSIWGAKALLLEGLKWRVGNGEKIGVWDDVWLPGMDSYRVSLQNLSSRLNLRVCDFIDGDRNCWNMNALKDHLKEEDITLVLKIPLSNRNVDDVRFWWPERNGIFSTRTAYWLGRLGHVRGWLQQLGGVDGAMWKTIWCLGGPPKLHHFLWRACADILPSQGRLNERHITDHGDCVLCGNVMESTVHAIFECNEASRVWAHSPFVNYISEAPKSSFADIFLWMKSKLDKTDLRTFATIGWAIWTFRNSFIHGEPWVDIQKGVLGFVRMVQGYLGYAQAVFNRPRVLGYPSRAGWSVPNEGWVKINVDAAVFDGRGVGLGMAARSDRGDLLAVGCKRLNNAWDAGIAEALAARYGLIVAKQLGYSRIVLECDASNIVKAIRGKGKGRAPFDLIIDDVCAISDDFVDFSCNHVRRVGNSVAHLAARLLAADGDCLFCDSFPQGIIALAESDCSE